jgi:hypothetical protein
MKINGDPGSAFMLQAIAKNKTGQENSGAAFSLTDNPGNNNKATDKAAATNNATATPKGSYDAVKEFTDYMKMSPAERMQYAWLKQHGISKEEFDSMPADEKQKLIDKMKHEFEEKIKAAAAQPKTRTDILV